MTITMTSLGNHRGVTILNGRVTSNKENAKWNEVEETIDGNPLEDITVIGGNELWYKAPPRDGVETINLIMKDGKIYKNTL